MIFDTEKIASHVERQLQSILGVNIDTRPFQEETIKQCQHCFSKIANKYFGEDVEFSPFHAGQYGLYLYFLSKTANNASCGGGKLKILLKKSII